MKRSLKVRGHYKKGSKAKRKGEFFSEKRRCPDSMVEERLGNSTIGQGKHWTRRGIQKRRRKEWRPKYTGE